MTISNNIGIMLNTIRLAKSNYYSKIFSDFKNNTKKIWKTINELKGNIHKRNTIRIIEFDGINHNNSSDIAEAFNHYFINIASQLDQKLSKSCRHPNSYLTGNYPLSMVVPIITTSDTNNVINTLKNKSSGINDIAASVVKSNSDLFSVPLTFLFNQSIRNGTFPARLKSAIITPIHKSGPNNDPKNYRPISQLPIFSKVFESLMKITLMQYLENKNILNHTQYGFRRKCNTFQALNTFSNDIFKYIQ